jgi:DNA-binding NarL/FixJ family response regulator
MSAYTIGVFDDHPVVTQGLKTLLAGDSKLQVSLVAHNSTELLDAIQKMPLDVLILDVIAPDVSGLELFQKIRTDFPRQKIVAYTTLSSPVLVENILLNGAKGYMNKRQSPEEIREALLKVCEGGRYVPEDYKHLLERRIPKGESVKITDREGEILSLILNGKTSKEIANQLSISLNTVENHRSNLFRKFEVKNVAELIRQATRLGFLSE